MGLTNSKIKLEESRFGSWTLLKFLGSGSSGGVYKVQDKITEEESALKITYLQNHWLIANSDFNATETQAKMRREFLLLHGKHHENIVNVHEHLEAKLNLNQIKSIFKSVVDSTDRSALLFKNNLEFWAREEAGVHMLFIRMELCGMNLRQWIDSNEEKGQSLWIAQTNIINGILEGLKFLHENKILHRDLKSENVYLGTGFQKFHVKIGDFGISRIIHSDASKTSELTNKPTTTPLYKAPELEAGNEYTLQADLYSLGLLIFEITRMLKSKDRVVEFCRIKTKKSNLGLPKEPYENASDVILQLIESDIETRLKSVGEVQLRQSFSLSILVANAKRINNIRCSWALVEFLGSGSFGGVYKLQNKITNEISAVKIIYQKKPILDDLSDAEKSAAVAKMLREFLVLHGKQHDNIVNVSEHLQTRLNLSDVQKLLENVDVANNKPAIDLKKNIEFWAKQETGVDVLLIRMELCGMNLRQWIDSAEEQGPDLWIAQANIVNGILKGLDYLHKNRILHRDLKSENVFLSIGFHIYNVKIGDFGTSRKIHSEDSNASEPTVKPITTPLYKAPELEDGNKYTLQADLYSLGLLIFEIIQMLKSNERRLELGRVKNKKNWRELPKEPYANAGEVILQLIEDDIKTRLKSVEEVKLKSPNLIILENKEYSCEEFGRILLIKNIITGCAKGGTVVNGMFDLSLDNRLIQNIIFRSELRISGNNNKLSNITINWETTESELWLTGRDNNLHEIRIECDGWWVNLEGDRNTISNVTPGKNGDAFIDFKVLAGVDHQIRNISIPQLYINFADLTSSCKVENVKLRSGWLYGKNHIFTEVKTEDLVVYGKGHKFINCKGRIMKRPTSKYEFVDCQFKINKV